MVAITGLRFLGPLRITRSSAAKGAITEADGKIKAITDNSGYYPVLWQPVERPSPPRRPGILMFMSFGRALFVAWCAWIGTVVVGSVVVLLLDKPEWRVAVGTLSLLIGLLAFIYARRI